MRLLHAKAGRSEPSIGARDPGATSEWGRRENESAVSVERFPTIGETYYDVGIVLAAMLGLAFAANVAFGT